MFSKNDAIHNLQQSQMWVNSLQLQSWLSGGKALQGVKCVVCSAPRPQWRQEATLAIMPGIPRSHCMFNSESFIYFSSSYGFRNLFLLRKPSPSHTLNEWHAPHNPCVKNLWLSGTIPEQPMESLQSHLKAKMKLFFTMKVNELSRFHKIQTALKCN